MKNESNNKKYIVSTYYLMFVTYKHLFIVYLVQFLYKLTLVPLTWYLCVKKLTDLLTDFLKCTFSLKKIIKKKVTQKNWATDSACIIAKNIYQVRNLKFIKIEKETTIIVIDISETVTNQSIRGRKEKVKNKL